MKRGEFRRFMVWTTNTYGVANTFANDGGWDDDLWVMCPECGEPILWEDWKDDSDLAAGYCPICGFNIMEGE